MSASVLGMFWNVSFYVSLYIGYGQHSKISNETPEHLKLTILYPELLSASS